jgi:hypothetical protein
MILCRNDFSFEKQHSRGKRDFVHTSTTETPLIYKKNRTRSIFVLDQVG